MAEHTHIAASAAVAASTVIRTGTSAAPTVVGERAHLGRDVFVGRGVEIGNGAEIGDGAVLLDGARIAAGASVPADVVVGPGVAVPAGRAFAQLEIAEAPARPGSPAIPASADKDANGRQLAVNLAIEVGAAVLAKIERVDTLGGKRKGFKIVADGLTARETKAIEALAREAYGPEAVVEIVPRLVAA
jgi:NDP-sugar pyrophosphorylase family protein